MGGGGRLDSRRTRTPFDQGPQVTVEMEEEVGDKKCSSRSRKRPRPLSETVPSAVIKCQELGRQ